MGDTVELIGLADTRQVTVTGLEMFQKTLDESMAGDNCGMLLRGVLKETIQVRAEADSDTLMPPGLAHSLLLCVQRGMVLAKPGSIKPHSKFEASVYVLKKEEGGRHSPFFTGYRPQFYMRTTDVTGNVAQVGTGKDWGWS